MYGPYLENFSSGYVITTLFVEPRGDIDVPKVDQMFSRYASSELGYDPLLAKISRSGTHITIRGDENVQEGSIYLPHEVADSMELGRMPDQKPVLISKNKEGNKVYDMMTGGFNGGS